MSGELEFFEENLFLRSLSTGAPSISDEDIGEEIDTLMRGKGFLSSPVNDFHDKLDSEGTCVLLTTSDLQNFSVGIQSTGNRKQETPKSWQNSHDHHYHQPD